MSCELQITRYKLWTMGCGLWISFSVNVRNWVGLGLEVFWEAWY